MNLNEKINIDLKEALKSGDKLKLETVRSIRALILEFEKSGSSKEITPEVEINILSSAAKKRKDAIEQYKNVGRNDLASKEEKELSIISKYLPEQLGSEELFHEIMKLAQQVGASTKADFPKLMPVAARAFKGKADGKVIKETVEKVLSGN